MQIVIDIPEEWVDDMAHEDFVEVDDLCQIILHSKVLPKGHGRLIDADAVLVEPFGNTYKDIDIAETIIEADKE